MGKDRIGKWGGGEGKGVLMEERKERKNGTRNTTDRWFP